MSTTQSMSAARRLALLGMAMDDADPAGVPSVEALPEDEAAAYAEFYTLARRALAAAAHTRAARAWHALPEAVRP